MPGPEPTSRGPIWSHRQCVILAAVVAALAIGLLVQAARFSTARLADEARVFRIDPNTAPYELIQTLPRIGSSRARDWVKARQKRPFRSLRDLEARVAGIGPATIQAIAPFLEFEEPAKPRARPRPRSVPSNRQTTLANAPAAP